MQINDITIQDIWPELLKDLPELIGVTGEFIELPPGLPVVRQRRSDFLYHVKAQRPHILHIEFQAQEDSSIADRMLEYRVDVRYRLRTTKPELADLPMDQLLVYGGPKDWKPKLEIREENLTYSFRHMDTKTIDPAPLLSRGSLGAAAFTVLCRGGTKLDVLETILNRIKTAPADVRPDSLLKLLVLSRLRGIEQLVKTEIEAMEMWPLNLEEITFIQNREKKARQEAREEARQEAREEALEATKRTIVKILQARFGHVPAHLVKRLDGRTRKQLDEINVRAATAVSLEAALAL